MIQLGQKVKDVVSGFTGIAVARTEWLNGCVRIAVQAKKIAGKDIGAMETIDEAQLEVLDAKPLALPRIPAPVAPARFAAGGGGRPDEVALRR